MQESILGQLFRGKEMDVDGDDAVAGPCLQITHPSHLPNNKTCRECRSFHTTRLYSNLTARPHFRDRKHVRGTLTRQLCPAKILIFIPIDSDDMRAVVIPKAGIPHNHPIFPRAKVPFAAASQYRKCIESTGPIGTTTLGVDKCK